ncbi:MAG: phage portal protein [Lactobacillaceae bacterium]|jgi:HK97 family phage portal protein|nr:phage portal protein [Lactobacillaceae bacterium]
MFFERRAIPIRGSGHSTNTVNSNSLLFDTYINAEQAIKNSDVWTAVNIISADIARVKFHTDKKSVDNLLQNPSHLTNRFNFYQTMIVQLLLSGNAYAIRRVDKQGKEFWEFVAPGNVMVNQTNNGQEITYDVRFNLTGEDDLKNISSQDMIHLRWTSLNGGIIGRSPLTALSGELGLQKASGKLSMNTIQKAIMPNAVLKASTPLTPEQREGVRSKFEEANTGKNAGRILVTDSLIDYQAIQVTADIAKLISANDWTRNQIAKAFLLPIDMLGGESEHSNAEQIRSVYNATLGRYIAPLQEELSTKLGVDITADIREAIDLDGTLIEQRTSDLVKNGVISSQVGVQILSESHSDLVTPEIVAKVGLENAINTKGVTVDGAGNTQFNGTSGIKG